MDDGNQPHEYTIEMDIPNLNNLLSMYNFNQNYNNSTTTHHPFNGEGNDISSHLGQCPAGNISQMYDAIDPLYVSDIKDLKHNIIDILNRRCEFEDEEYDHDKYESKEIDELYETIKNTNEEFKALQIKLHNAEEILKYEIDTLKSNSETLDTFIKFLKSLASVNHEDMTQIIENINTLSSKLADIDSFKKAKKDYITERKNILKYIYFLRKVNKFNITNMCVVCMDVPVTHFINQCGHTFCESCLKKHLDTDDITNLNNIYHDKKCPICRKYVNSVNPLYFL
tara:strand:- start:437 stop:1285 length:849 start_codon:yes stop_codon:yes gene_type:complete